MAIPKIRHLIWLGDKPVPDHLRMMADSFLPLHQNWRTEVWTDSRLPDMLCRSSFDGQSTLLGRIEILRLELLIRYGGMHTDWDLSWQQPVENAIGKLDAFACTAENGLRGELILDSVVMGFLPGHRILQKAAAILIQDFEARQTQIISMSWYVAQAIGELWKYDLEAVKDFQVIPARIFCPYTPQNGRSADETFPEAVAVHKYTGLWVGL